MNNFIDNGNTIAIKDNDKNKNIKMEKNIIINNNKIKLIVVYQDRCLIKDT